MRDYYSKLEELLAAATAIVWHDIDVTCYESKNNHVQFLLTFYQFWSKR